MMYKSREKKKTAYHASKKYSRTLPFGPAATRPGEMLFKQSTKLARIPGGSSFMITIDCRRILTGILGFSIVKNNRKDLGGFRD